MAGHVQDFAACPVQDHNEAHFVDNMSLTVDVVVAEERYAEVEGRTLVVCLLRQNHRLSVVGMSSIYTKPDMLITALLISIL